MNTKRLLTQLSAVLCLLMTTVTGAAQTTVDESQVTILTSISSTGHQAFNTGYTHKANTRVVMDCNVKKNSQRTWEALLGGRKGDFQSNAFCFFSRTDGNDVPCFNRSGHEPRGTGFVYGERIILTCEGQTATWVRYSNQNTVAGSVTTTGTADDGKTPMFLFDLNTSSTVGGLQEDNSKSVMTLYGCKIYEGTTLKCDFVPAKYNNEVGLYDRVNQTFDGSITDSPFDEATTNEENYYRALSTIVDGQHYYVFTMYKGQKYYLTADGYLSSNNADAQMFCFVKARGKEYEFGFMLQNGFTYFTNPVEESDAALTKGHLNTTDKNSRHNWEAQVFFLNSDGKYAIRSTNAVSGTTGWNRIGSAFWTVNAVASGPLAEYSFNMNYVWQLEAGVSSIPIPSQELLTNGQCDGTYNGWTKTDGGSGWVIDTNDGAPYWKSSHQTCTLSQTVTLAEHQISAESVDNGEVWCSISAEMKSLSEKNGDGARVCKVTVDMLDGNDNSLGIVTVLNDNSYYPVWEIFRTAPFILKSGTRKLTYRVSAQDAPNWAGQFGPCFKNLSIKAIVGSGDYDLYPVWIGSKQVTSGNKNDVLGDGKVRYTPGEGSGTLTFTGSPNITGMHNSALIAAEDIDLTIEAPNGLTLSYETDANLGYAIYLRGERKNLVINGSDLTIVTKSNGINAAWSATLNLTGKFTSNTKNGAISAAGGVTINGEVDATAGSSPAISAMNGNVTIKGNVKISTSATSISAGGDITLNGPTINFSGDNSYAPILMGTNINIKGKLTAAGQWQVMLARGNVTIDGNVTASSAGSNTIMTTNGDITIVSGKWDLTSNTGKALFTSNGNINIPDDHFFSQPVGAQVKTDDSGTYIVEADGVTIPQHVVISSLNKVTPTTTTLEDGETYFVSNDVTVNERIIIDGNVTLVLEEGKTLTASKGIEVADHNALTIEGPGSLVANADEGNAAIGGSAHVSYGIITINGGHITATGGKNGAGIGGGTDNYYIFVDNYPNSQVTINGGVVNATGGENAAGIGGGFISSWASIDGLGSIGVPGYLFINGGQVTATGGEKGSEQNAKKGPGIGDTYSDSRANSMLTLSWTNPDDFILISSFSIRDFRILEGKAFLVEGTEDELSSNNAYYLKNMGGKKVMAKSSFFITESTTVMGDGCTYYVNADVTNNNRIKVLGSAVLHLNEGYKLTATRGFQVEGENTLTIEGDGKLIATADRYDAAIGGNCSNGNAIDYIEYGHIIINGGYITAKGGEGAAGIGGSATNQNRQGNSTITINGGHVFAEGGVNAAGIGGGYNMWYREPGNEDIGTPGTIVINGGQVSAFGGDDTDNAGYRCSGIGYGSHGADIGQLTLGWTNPSDYIYASNDYGFSNIAFVEGKRFIVEGTYEEITLENFADAKWKKLLPIVARDPISITSETTTLEGNLTYVVDSDVTLNSRLRVKGTPTLQLNEGKTLTAPMGIQVAHDVVIGITSTLTIEGSGALTASADNGDAAIGGDVGQACGIIYINGGQITATGSGNSVGAGAGQGGEMTGEIQLSWTNPTDFVFINSLGCNYTHLTNDKPFIIDSSGEEANNTQIAGNKLVPYPQCATPTIVYRNGKLLFECETEDVEFVSNFATPEGAEGNGSEAMVPTVYTVTVYAKKDRHRDSETVTKDIDIRGLTGDSNGDGKVTIVDAVGIVNFILGNH